MIPNKVKNYLLSRQEELEREIIALETEKSRILDILEEKDNTPSILENGKRIWPKINFGYRVAYKYSITKKFQLIDEIHSTLYHAESVCAGLNSESAIVDKDGNEIEEYGEGF